MRYLLLFFVVFYVNAKAIETKELSEHLPEDLLVMSLDKISQGDIKSAINDINTLIKQVPNFKLAHLIHGDLLTAHSGNLNFLVGKFTNQTLILLKILKKRLLEELKLSSK